MRNLKKPAKTILMALPIGLASLYFLFWAADFLVQTFVKPEQIMDFGVTFSPIYAQNLTFSSSQVYQAMLTELGVKKIRLPVYWNLVESKKDEFDFQDYDNMLDLARQYQAQVILAIGYKLPRWPECFQPLWATHLESQERQERILVLLENTVKHFQNRPEVVAWQVENEPSFNFGTCGTISQDFLAKEINLVRSLDQRPLILTDSGEVGQWIREMRLADQLGISLYRTTWHPVFGFFHYPLLPSYYYLKAQLLKTFTTNKPEIFIAELQTEPWTSGTSVTLTPMSEQNSVFSLEDFQQTINFASQTKFKESYLWGVEWWYWMKLHGEPGYWEFAKTLFH